MSDHDFWVFRPCEDYMYDLSAAFDAELVGDDEEIDGLVRDFMAEAKIPGCAIGVTDGEEVLYLKTYGARFLGPRHRAAPAGSELNWLPNERWRINTPSAIGSVSKTVTAVSALRLAQQGLLDLDVRLIDSWWFPGYFLNLVPDAWWNLRIRDLLAHTTGLSTMPSGGIDTEFGLHTFWAHVSPLPTVPALVYYHPGEWPRRTLPVLWGTPIEPFSQGLDARYSNVGYAIVGAAIDSLTATASSLPDYRRGYEAYTAQMLQGAGMLTPCLQSHWRSIPGRAHGYALANNRFRPDQLPTQPTDHYGTRWYAAPGGWSMTIGDLTRLLIVVHRMASPWKDQMFDDPHTAGLPERVGLGVLLPGDGSWASRGDFFGYSAHIRLWPGSGTAAGGRTIGVAVCCNRQDGEFKSDHLGSLVEQIRDVAGGRSPGGFGRRRRGTAVEELIERYGGVRARILAAQILAAHATPEQADTPPRATAADLPLTGDLRRAVAARDGDQIAEVIALILDSRGQAEEPPAAIVEDAHWPL